MSNMAREAGPTQACSLLVVVPCLNEARQIGPLLDQLSRAAARLGGLVVVVDGGSTDGTREIVACAQKRLAAVRFLHNPARIQSAGVNLAVERYGQGATHLIRIDAHCAYPDDYCDVLLDESRRHDAASVVVSMEARGAARLQRAIAATQNAPVGNGGSRHRLEPVGEYVDHGHHALIRLDAFRAVGGYDAAFSHNEDAEFDHRLRAAGHRIWLTARTRAVYFPRDGLRPLARQYYNYGRGRAQNLVKHRARPKLRQAKVIAILPLVVLATLAPIVPALAFPALSWLAYCAATALALAVKARDPGLLAAAPAAMVMHLAWSAGFWSRVVEPVATPEGRPA